MQAKNPSYFQSDPEVHFLSVVGSKVKPPLFSDRV